eukprot:gene5587-14972_t
MCGALPARPPSPRAWALAQKQAREAAAGGLVPAAKRQALAKDPFSGSFRAVPPPQPMSDLPQKPKSSLAVPVTSGPQRPAMS